ncbi:O-glucosyltransferase rumi homolog isoform X2 [Cynara cardunculus var. scolymus]|uniref:Lipopolysaccharide-modifying protein n=1 Tax=Cynara cardunculus var. scolymus TaxID=59895 RepID=A0A103YMH6_CYNCS|nr:O-glucosyltransferase rumi homolog isoform X2 [Cynara cardunculus var. scolymus]KVI11906.1 Lipopolysaccharide-modifying protein [Cynara cardunculus var. scolymus]
MALFSRKIARIPSPVLRFFGVLFIFTLAFLLLLEVDNLASQTKTIIGHNLEPTPWHAFPAKTFENETKIGRASMIVRCSYLSCRTKSKDGQTMLTDESEKCPVFYGWIHHDLEPWSKTRISHTLLMEAKKFASLHIVIIGGKLYVEYYYDCVQSRALFTVWGLLQLLRRYPGMVPDVELMFDCMDRPIIHRDSHSAMPLPIFRYCTTPDHFDIPFPDWSFWGWAEVHLGPWQEEFQSIKQGSQVISWEKKFPYAYWKGNPDVNSRVREELLFCNDTNKWGAQILRQNWTQEILDGFKNSKLSSQCNHRYKIYAEGYAWSVSLKYILSCGCVPLIIKPKYEDFFSRGLFPMQNYWPISSENICRSIKTAVDWGNSHPSEAKAIGKAVQDFMERMNIERIYDYMFHLITEYAKLQDFKPVRPSTALEECISSLLCYADENQRGYLERSATSPSPSPPCKLPPPNAEMIKKWLEAKNEILNKTQLII